MLTKINNFADAFMEAVGIMGSAWSQDEDCKTILERMEAEENIEEMDSDGTLRRRVRPRRKTPASDGKSSMDASTEDGEEADDDASDDEDEPSDEDTINGKQHIETIVGCRCSELIYGNISGKDEKSTLKAKQMQAKKGGTVEGLQAPFRANRVDGREPGGSKARTKTSDCAVVYTEKRKLPPADDPLNKKEATKRKRIQRTEGNSSGEDGNFSETSEVFNVEEKQPADADGETLMKRNDNIT